MTNHITGKHHKGMAKACSSNPVASFFKPHTQQSVIEAESLRSQFVSKHNLPCLSPVIMSPSSFIECFQTLKEPRFFLVDMLKQQL